MSDLQSLLSDPKCGTSVITRCEGLTVDLNVTGLQLLTSEVMSVANFALQAAAQGIAGEMTLNQVKAINAGRCAILNLGDNAWTWLAGTYYLAKTFADASQMAEIKGYLDTYYPYICTCKYETDQLSALFGGNEETAAVMSACSEKSQMEAVVNKADTLINIAFNVVFPNGAAGPWTNSTVPEKSNVTFTATQALTILGGTVGGMGWDYTKLNMTAAVAMYGDYDMADGTMNKTALRPFINKVLAVQGPAMAPAQK